MVMTRLEPFPTDFVSDALAIYIYIYSYITRNQSDDDYYYYMTTVCLFVCVFMNKCDV